MSWTVEMHPRAAKELARLDAKHRANASRHIDEIAADPYSRAALKTGDKPPTYRRRIGDYRIVYEIHQERRVVRIMYIEHRSQVYKRQRRNPEAWIPNPTVPGGRQLVEITDRAKRYRAATAIEQREKRCVYCGAPASSNRRLDREHIDGREANNNPENLAYACRPCNTAKGAHFARRGRGVRTRQFNPAKPITGLAAWLEAVHALKGEPSTFTLSDAIARVRATPPDQRSAFAAEIWSRRRARGTDRLSAVPF